MNVVAHPVVDVAVVQRFISNNHCSCAVTREMGKVIE